MKTLVTTLKNNQTVIFYKDDKGALNGDSEFWSYETKIAENKNGKIYLDAEKWNYSATTIKYLCEYLGYKGKKTILEAIKNNILQLTNLN